MLTFRYDYRVDDDPEGEFSFGEPFPPIQQGTYSTEENLSRCDAEDRIAQNLQEIEEDAEITYLHITKVERK